MFLLKGFLLLIFGFSGMDSTVYKLFECGLGEVCDGLKERHTFGVEEINNNLITFVFWKVAFYMILRNCNFNQPLIK